MCERIGGRLGDAYSPDKDWVDAVDARAAKRLEMLESELAGYKTNAIKESIRMGHVDLGDFHRARGDAANAFKEDGETARRRLATVEASCADLRHELIVAQKERDAAVQKRAYKLFAALMRPQKVGGDKNMVSWLASNRDAAEETLVAGSGVCAPAARRYRLRCVAAILPALMEREQAAEETRDKNTNATDPARTMRSDSSFAALLGELIVATKETNARTRVQAFKLLVDIPRAMERRAGRAGGAIILRYTSACVRHCGQGSACKMPRITSRARANSVRSSPTRARRTRGRSSESGSRDGYSGRGTRRDAHRSDANVR